MYAFSDITIQLLLLKLIYCVIKSFKEIQNLFIVVQRNNPLCGYKFVWNVV